MGDPLDPPRANAGALGPLISTVLLMPTLSSTLAIVYVDLFLSLSAAHYEGY